MGLLATLEPFIVIKSFKKIFSPRLQSFYTLSELNLEKFRLKNPFFVKSKIQIQLFKQNK